MSYFPFHCLLTLYEDFLLPEKVVINSCISHLIDALRQDKFQRLMDFHIK
ncbi:hypothetical protein L579_1234 [Pantoea sp. AS-PWVM4]|nr:hypothetical protein L579_1234 [Pantoea sp. AS-PWVM4]